MFLMPMINLTKLPVRIILSCHFYCKSFLPIYLPVISSVNSETTQKQAQCLSKFDFLKNI